jgi:hypothetical protein
VRLQELLESQLSSLVDADQRERNEYANFVKTKAAGDWEKGAKMYAELKNRSTDDIYGEIQRLKPFTQTKFNFESFTKEDWDDYFLLAQHCDFDRKFQQQALSIITKYEGQGSHFKYLSDRISCGLSGTQKYGTQDICDKD